MTDLKIMHRMFFNHRSERGVRLSNHGLQIMQNYFRSYTIAVPADEEIKPLHLVFLDERVSLPYYFDAERIVVFDDELAVKLRLVDGRLSKLVEIEMGETEA